MNKLFLLYKVIYLKQQHSSTLQPADVQKKLKEMADKKVSGCQWPIQLSS